MHEINAPSARGRGSSIDPPNRFVPIHLEDDQEYLEHDDDALEDASSPRTQYFADEAQTVVTENNSPDVPFRYSLNPYRGCLHGCSYCFARPTHEYLGLSGGLDFETKIFVKHRAPELLRAWLARAGYEPAPITISGVTDCYQPIERRLRITRRCLEVALEARQPIALITKNALITRDLDLLARMAELNLVRVAISVTSLDQSLTKVMEPRTSSPAARLRTIEQLAGAGVPVQVLVAPVIPAVNDHEIPAILQAVKEAGAHSAGYVLLRLPLSVEPVFLDWLRRTFPDRAAKVEARVRATRGGKLYESKFGERMRGRGEIADHIANSFQVFAARHGLDRKGTPLDASRFRRPLISGQQWLFEGV